MGDEMCPTTIVESNATNFIMNDPSMENRLRYSPPLDAYGNAFAVFTLVVQDQVYMNE